MYLDASLGPFWRRQALALQCQWSCSSLPSLLSGDTVFTWHQARFNVTGCYGGSMNSQASRAPSSLLPCAHARVVESRMGGMAPWHMALLVRWWWCGNATHWGIRWICWTTHRHCAAMLMVVAVDSLLVDKIDTKKNIQLHTRNSHLKTLLPVLPAAVHVGTMFTGESQGGT